MELAPFGIDVVVIEPGAIRTEWAGIAAEHLRHTSGAGAYAAFARRHAAMLSSAEVSSLPSRPEVVARTIARAVRARRPKTRYATGGGAGLVLLLRRVLSDRMFDRLMWQVSQRAIAPAAKASAPATGRS
jgi:NAD(P)-dependent dehydrogenase (short-subunit alcohol dehydrogenase family)